MFRCPALRQRENLLPQLHLEAARRKGLLAVEQPHGLGPAGSLSHLHISGQTGQRQKEIYPGFALSERLLAP